MHKINLNSLELETIEEALDDSEVAERFKKKLLIITMKNKGAKGIFIADCLRLSLNTVTNCVKQYLRGGITELMDNRIYKPSSSLEPYWMCIECNFKAFPPCSAKEASHRIEQLTGINLSESQCRRIMKDKGMKLRKCAQIPGKADPQLQFNFIQEQLKPRLEQAQQGARKVYFVDAAHFVMGAFLGMVWCFARVFIKSSSGRQRYNVLGAVDSHSKEIVKISTKENINALTVCQLLKKIRHHCGDEVAITLVMDNARYQRALSVKEQAQKLNIELLFLPAYSPNINIIERLWKLVKKQCLLNRYYENFKDFKQAIDNCILKLNEGQRKELKALLTLKFQTF